eukprot:scaffold135170_cov32-Tisochrysis_lutea.AAC.3
MTFACELSSRWSISGRTLCKTSHLAVPGDGASNGAEMWMSARIWTHLSRGSRSAARTPLRDQDTECTERKDGTGLSALRNCIARKKSTSIN